MAISDPKASAPQEDYRKPAAPRETAEPANETKSDKKAKGATDDLVEVPKALLSKQMKQAYPEIAFEAKMTRRALKKSMDALSKTLGDIDDAILNGAAVEGDDLSKKVAKYGLGHHDKPNHFVQSAEEEFRQSLSATIDEVDSKAEMDPAKRIVITEVLAFGSKELGQKEYDQKHKGGHRDHVHDDKMQTALSKARDPKHNPNVPPAEGEPQQPPKTPNTAAKANPAGPAVPAGKPASR